MTLYTEEATADPTIVMPTVGIDIEQIQEQARKIIDLAMAIGSQADWMTPCAGMLLDAFTGLTLIAIPTVPGIAPIQIVWYLQENGIYVILPDLDFPGDWLFIVVDDPERAHTLTEWCWG